MLVGKLKGELKTILNLPIAGLDVQFADTKTRKPLGRSIKNTATFYMPIEDSKIPALQYGTRGTGPLAGAALTLSNIHTNSEYYAEKAEYLICTRLTRPVSVIVTNTGGHLLRNVRLEMDVKKLPDGVLLLEEHEIPELPKKERSIAYSIATEGLRGLKSIHRRQGEVDISSHSEEYKVEIGFGNVQAKASVASDMFFIGSVESRVFSLAGFVYADELSEPVPVELNIEFETAAVEMTMNDLKTPLPEEKNVSDEEE